MEPFEKGLQETVRQRKLEEKKAIQDRNAAFAKAHEKNLSEYRRLRDYH